MQLFIDTNIFLSFYALNQEDLKELSKLADRVAAGEVTLLITDQILDEFYRNREQRIEGALKAFYGQTFNTQVPQICEGYPEIEYLRTTLKEYEKAHCAVVEKVSNDIKTKNLQADRLLHHLFDRSTKLEIDGAIIDRARLRMGVGNPPGKNNSLGDAINWECLLTAVPDRADLFFISGDKDYSSPLEEDEFSGFLRDEWERRKKSTIHFYRRLSIFLKEHLPEIGMASLRDQSFLVRELATSQSIADVHKYVTKLRIYQEFTVTQANSIVMAALNNQQVTWSLEEESIRAFFMEIMARYDRYLDPVALAQLGSLLVADTTAPIDRETPPTNKPPLSLG
jgi:predicted nucleic acid-binding protein